MKKNKKISIIINDLSFYSHRLPIAEELIKKGFEVCIGYGVLEEQISIFRAKRLEICFDTMKRGGVNPIKEIQTIINIYHKRKPDLIHLVTIKPYLYGGIVST